MGRSKRLHGYRLAGRIIPSWRAGVFVMEFPHGADMTSVDVLDRIPAHIVWELVAMTFDEWHLPHPDMSRAFQWAWDLRIWHEEDGYSWQESVRRTAARFFEWYLEVWEKAWPEEER